MSPNRTIVLAAACVALVSGSQPPVAAQARPSLDLQKMVEQAVVDAALAPGPPEVFARALASAGVPVGFVSRSSAITPRRPSDAAGAQGLRPLGAALQQFRDSHPDQDASVVAGMVFLSPRQSSCAPRLNRGLSVRYSGPVYGFFDYLRKLIEAPISGVPPGIVAGGGAPDKAEAALYTANVTVETVDASLQEAMSSFIRQVPGLAWGIREEDDSRTARTRCVWMMVSRTSRLDTSIELK